MAALKITPTDLDQALKDKRLIEAIRNRLNEKLQDPKLAKKAALILETWINQKTK